MNPGPLRVRRRCLLAAIAAGILCAGPTPGDVGGCGQPVQELDAELFFQSKRSIDCDRCAECGFATDACDDACAGSGAESFPDDCLPLVHDGEVCLRRLLNDSCQDYRAYVVDRAPTVPTECNFCPAQ